LTNPVHNASIAELADADKLRTQPITHSLSHPAYFMLWEPKLLL